MRASKLIAAFAAVPLLLASAVGTAHADDIVNRLDNTIDNQWEKMALTVGAGTGSTEITVVATDRNQEASGCNLVDGKTVTVTVSSSAPAIATVSPSQLTFGACGVAQSVTVSPVAAGTSAIEFGVAKPDAQAFETQTARFEAVVSAAPRPVDGSAPVVTPEISGTLGDNGWYTTDVTVSWTVLDNESLVTSPACASTTITSDQAATTYSCSATSAGGMNTQSVTIKRDATAPVITPSDVAAGAWGNGDVSQEFAADGGPSGLRNTADASFTLTATQESENAETPTTASRTVYDGAGNSTTRSLSAFIDRTEPVISGDDVNDTTWRRSPLSREFSAADMLSGLAAAADGSFTLTAADESPVGGTTTVSKQVFDRAGNSDTRTLSARIDLSAPTIKGGDIEAGDWRNTPLTEEFTASDDRSGLADQTDASFILTAQADSPNATTPTTASKTVRDMVGNSVTRSVSAFIDTRAPSVTLSGPLNGATYATTSVPTASCNTTDALSGVAAEATLSVVTGTAGAVTVECTGARDNAGNGQAAPVSVTYRVLTLGGFNKNFDGSGIPKAKAGSAIPLAWSFTDGSGIVSPLSSVVISSVALASCQDEIGLANTEIAEVTAGSSGLQLLPDGSYQVNWKSTTVTGCRRVTVSMYTGADDEKRLFASRSVSINFTK